MLKVICSEKDKVASYASPYFDALARIYSNIPTAIINACQWQQLVPLLIRWVP